MWFALAVIVAMMSSVVYTLWRSARLPAYRPQLFKRRAGYKVLACLGDSITHGHVGQAYISQVRRQLVDEKIDVMNAGINADLAYSLNQRIEAVIKLQPDYITVLIGTNDANASLEEAKAQMYIKLKKLPTKPDIEFYRLHLQALVQGLKQQTSANIALLSLPVLGEHLESKANQAALRYSAVIKQIALEEEVAYLSLNEAQRAVLATEAKTNAMPVPGAEDRSSMAKAQFAHYVLGRSWDAVAAGNNLVLTTETIHMSDRGAAMIAKQVLGFVEAVSGVEQA